jgi:hypothetical protein
VLRLQKLIKRHFSSTSPDSVSRIQSRSLLSILFVQTSKLAHHVHPFSCCTIFERPFRKTSVVCGGYHRKTSNGPNSRRSTTTPHGPLGRI